MASEECDYLMQVLQGNVNTFVAEMRNISPPIIARKIRLVPYSSYQRTVCMRVELYGCTWRGVSTVQPAEPASSLCILLFYILSGKRAYGLLVCITLTNLDIFS